MILKRVLFLLFYCLKAALLLKYILRKVMMPMRVRKALREKEKFEMEERKNERNKGKH